MPTPESIMRKLGTTFDNFAQLTRHLPYTEPTPGTIVPATYSSFDEPIMSTTTPDTVNIAYIMEDQTRDAKHRIEGHDGGPPKRTILVDDALDISASRYGIPDTIYPIEWDGSLYKHRVTRVDRVRHPTCPRLVVKRVTIECEEPLPT